MASNRKASIPATARPIYAAVHPAGITTLADIVVPAQTLVSGPAAGDGEWAWTATAPDGTDVSAYLDDATLAEPTLDVHTACFTGGAHAGGLWALVGVPTVDGIAGPAVTLLVRVGDADGWVTCWAPTLTAVAAASWAADGDFSADGGLVTAFNGASANSLGPDGVNGIRIAPKAGSDVTTSVATAPGVGPKLANIVPNYGDDMAVQVVYGVTYTTAPSTAYSAVAAAVFKALPTSPPRGFGVLWNHDGSNMKRTQVRYNSTTAAVISAAAQATAIRGWAVDVVGQTARTYTTTTHPTSAPPTDFSTGGWVADTDQPLDARNPGSSTNLTLSTVIAPIMSWRGPAGNAVDLFVDFGLVRAKC